MIVVSLSTVLCGLEEEEGHASHFSHFCFLQLHCQQIVIAQLGVVH